MERNVRIYVAGAETLIGRGLFRHLRRQGYTNVIGDPEGENPLRNPALVDVFFAQNRPQYVFFAAGKSGGIRANQNYPADLMLDNLVIEANVIGSAHRYQVEKLLYLASSCSYPRLAPQPIREESLLTGPLEPTNEAYAVAKIAGIELCRAFNQQYGTSFLSAVPANTFGPDDDTDVEDAHVIPALMMRMAKAKALNLPTVDIWGTGSPEREFIFVDDLADACEFVMQNYVDSAPINLGSGHRISIRALAEQIQQIVGYEGKLYFDTSKPDGMPLKMLDSEKLRAMGWQAKTSFAEALAVTFRWVTDSMAKRDFTYG